MTDDVRRIQRACPQLFHACHVEHTTRRRPHGLSDRDSSLLSHLDARAPISAGVAREARGVTYVE